MLLVLGMLRCGCDVICLDEGPSSGAFDGVRSRVTGPGWLIADSIVAHTSA